MAVAQIIKEIRKWKEVNDGFPPFLQAEDWSDTEFHLNAKARDHFANVLCMDLVALYLEVGSNETNLISSDGGIDLDGLTFYIVLKNGKVLRFSNSEWGGIGVEGNL